MNTSSIDDFLANLTSLSITNSQQTSTVPTTNTSSSTMQHTYDMSGGSQPIYGNQPTQPGMFQNSGVTSSQPGMFPNSGVTSSQPGMFPNSGGTSSQVIGSPLLNNQPAPAGNLLFQPSQVSMPSMPPTSNYQGQPLYSMQSGQSSNIAPSMVQQSAPPPNLTFQAARLPGQYNMQNIAAQQAPARGGYKPQYSSKGSRMPNTANRMSSSSFPMQLPIQQATQMPQTQLKAPQSAAPLTTQSVSIALKKYAAAFKYKPVEKLEKWLQTGYPNQNLVPYSQTIETVCNLFKNFEQAALFNMSVCQNQTQFSRLMTSLSVTLDSFPAIHTMLIEDIKQMHDAYMNDVLSVINAMTSNQAFQADPFMAFLDHQLRTLFVGLTFELAV